MAKLQSKNQRQEKNEMTKEYNVAVVGATGLVGETLLAILQQRQFPVAKLFPLASQRSAGKHLQFADREFLIEDVAEFDFSKADIVFFMANGDIARQYVPIAEQHCAVVIDNSATFRYEPEVPLIVPEVNAEHLRDWLPGQVIANPNCSTIQMVVALKPIYDAVGISRINVATYQSVSGSGREGIAELNTQTRASVDGGKLECQVYPKQIAFNILPHIDVFEDNDYTREEMKMVWETQKIFADPDLLVNPTAARVPVYHGHAEAVHIETKEKITKKQAVELLSQARGVQFINGQDYPTPATDGTGSDVVYVGRVREDISHPNGLNMWVVADNIRKGAALNAVQIAEYLFEQNRI